MLSFNVIHPKTIIRDHVESQCHEVDKKSLGLVILTVTARLFLVPFVTFVPGMTDGGILPRSSNHPQSTTSRNRTRGGTNYVFAVFEYFASKRSPMLMSSIVKAPLLATFSSKDSSLS